ncbi:MAG: SsrA-binding protein, partial [Nitrospirales bacterium]
MTKTQPENIVGSNRKAFYDYSIDQKFEAGIVLVGTEVKSLREGKVNLRESYASVDSGQVMLHQ